MSNEIDQEPAGIRAANRRHGNIVAVEQLAEALHEDDVFVADCRFDLSDVTAGRKAYDEAHIPGAVFFDLDDDLSIEATRSGGRHPLPPVEQFVALFEARGIDDRMTVVCYDDSGGGFAGRLWWMLRYIGHDNVALLDGGYSAWMQAGHRVTAEVPVLSTGRLTVRLQPRLLATAADVKRVTETGGGVIIDSRAAERYRGEVEPLDPVAGHIPGALNFPWQDNVDENGYYVAVSKLRHRFRSVAASRTENIIVHCGSGVTGCMNVFALERAGLPAKLYVGGWSDWCSDPSNPVETGDETDAAPPPQETD